jgi:hypothetical protein
MGLDSLIAALEAFEKSRTIGKETNRKLLPLLKEAIEAQKYGHELRLATDQVIDLVGRLGLPLDWWTALEVFNCHLDTWIEPLSLTS